MIAKRCEKGPVHLPHEWREDQGKRFGPGSCQWYECPGVYDKPTINEACERLAAWLEFTSSGHHDPDEEPVLLARADVVALVAYFGWSVTVEESREVAKSMDEAMFE